jgi:hypothetical protein
LKYGVLTGITRIIKEGVFFGMKYKIEEVKEWYNGYFLEKVKCIILGLL